MNATNKTKLNCQGLIFLFKNYDYDILILQIYYVMAALITITINLLFIKRLLKSKVQSRPNKLFFIMSLSDAGVGMFTIPVTSLPLFTRDWDLICKLSPLLLFFTYFPFTFSWFMVIMISLDRVFMITKFKFYGRYVTMKVLYGIIFSIMILIIIVTLFISATDTYLNSNKIFHFRLTLAQIILEFTSIIVVIIAYIYLYLYIRSKSRKMNIAKVSGINYNKKLVFTIGYIFLCLLIFTIPQLMILIVLLKTNLDLNPIFSRNAIYWQAILLYSNSYTNAFILLHKIKRSSSNSSRMKSSSNEQFNKVTPL